MDFKLILSNQKGVALLLVLFIMAFFALLGATFLNMVINETKMGGRYLAKAQSFYLAEAGVRQGTWLLKKSAQPLTSTQNIAGSLETGQYKATLIPKEPGQGKQVIEGLAEGSGSEAITKVRVTWEVVYYPIPAKVTMVRWQEED